MCRLSTTGITADSTADSTAAWLDGLPLFLNINKRTPHIIYG